MNLRRWLATLWVPTALGCPLLAQGPTFQSPGMPTYSVLGQTNRFSTEFNPAFGLVIDGFVDYRDTHGGGDYEEGFDGTLRLVDLSAASYIDPSAWVYVILSSSELEPIEVEEAAIEYIGFESNARLKAGRFFVDFGKQMQSHLEELRTLRRPLVLREFLGSELGGTGLQYDDWFALRDEIPVRFSVAIFTELRNEDEEAGGLTRSEPYRQDFDELALTARLTGMGDQGENGQLQVGASARYVPNFSLEGEGLQASDLSNLTLGLDVTYGWIDDTATKHLVVGGEWLTIDGDLYGALDDPVTPSAITVVDDRASGAFAYVDYGWNRFQSAGCQWSWAQALEDPDRDDLELDLYYTKHLSDYRRLRFGVTFADSDRVEDSLLFYVQFTNWAGTHAHSFNW